MHEAICVTDEIDVHMHCSVWEPGRRHATECHTVDGAIYECRYHDIWGILQLRWLYFENLPSLEVDSP
jgi:hypothetical protein